MKHNIPELEAYGYNPTDTTSKTPVSFDEILQAEEAREAEERALAIIAKAKAECVDALYRAFDGFGLEYIAEEFNYNFQKCLDFCEAQERHYNIRLSSGEWCEIYGKKWAFWSTEDDIEKLAEIKRQAKEAVARLHWADGCLERVLANIDACNTPEALFWGFFFDFGCIGNEEELKKDDLEALEELKRLAKENAKLYK